MIKKDFIFCMLIMVILFIGCTDKKNLTGTSGYGGPQPQETEIASAQFTKIYSYEDSIRINNSDVLLMGNYESNEFNNQAVTLLKFTSLVDSFDQIANLELRMKIREKHDFDVIDNTTLKLGKMKTDWFETTSDWNSPTDSTSWSSGTSFSLLPNVDIEFLNDLQIELEDDTLKIFLPENILEEWILADSLNYGLALLTEEDDKFIVFYSAEYSEDYGPRLFFDYAQTPDDTLAAYYRTPTHDLHIFATDNLYSIFENRLILSNIQPIRMYLKFDIPNSLFTDFSIDVIEDTTAFLQRLTINRADLILTSVSPSPYPPELNKSINIDPYIMLSDTLNLDDPHKPMITSDDFKDLIITSSNDSLNSAEFKIDITKIIQNLVSKEYDNHGIMLNSIYENKDFKHTEFVSEPKIKIIFTPPYLDD